MIQNKNLPSFCTSNLNVLKSLIIFARYNNLPLLIETTSNQINQYGGYTNLKPKQFVNKIKKIAKNLNFKNEIIFGADHLGPLPWKHLGANKAIKNAKQLIRAVVTAGYKKIHIDTGMKLKGDKYLSKKKIFNRSRLIFDSVKKKKIKNIFFVFGTEVPIAGGENNFKFKNTKINSIKKDIKEYKKLKNNFSLVIEPGLGFSNQKIYKLKMNSFSKKKILVDSSNLTYEAHSTDYQDLNSLKKLVKNNFKFLKVGPELTFNYLKAIIKLEKIEKIKFKNNLSQIKKKILKEMEKNQVFWKNYYKGSKKKIEYLKLESYLDRSRYYWNTEKVIHSLKILEKNINSINENLLFNNKKNLNKKLYLKNKLKLSNFDFIIYESLLNSFSKYYRSCNFILKK
jgi:D-tagatose-1,6-bisphosphate aldolase subunit GatZ/KbaZ